MIGMHIHVVCNVQAIRHVTVCGARDNLFIYLAHSANLPKGLYILADVFFFIFFISINDRLSRPSISESNRSIFTKILGLVDGWKGLLTLFITIAILLSKD